MMKIIIVAFVALAAVFAEEKIEAALEGRGCGCNTPRPRSSTSSRSSVSYHCRQWSSSSSSSDQCCPPRGCINPPSESSSVHCGRCECTSSSSHCKPLRCRQQSYSSSYGSLPSASPDQPDVLICPCPPRRDCSPCDPGFLIAPQQARNFEAPGHCACFPCDCDACPRQDTDCNACRQPIRGRKH